MSINNIQLPESLIANLYKTSLILTDETIHISSRTQSTDAETKKAPPGYLGENNKNIVLIVNYEDAVYIRDEELSFLASMLSACKLNLADVAIINRYNSKESNYKELSKSLKCRITMLFGVDPVSFGLPLNFPHFQVQSFAGNTFLFSPPLEEVKADDLLKSKLWVCLRRIFNI